MKNTKLLSNTIIVWLVAGLCCLLWGSAFPMIKVGYAFLDIASSDTGSIILFAGVRFFIAGLLTIAIFSIVEHRLLLPTKRSLPRIANLSLFQTILQYIFFYLGLAFTTGQKASIINGSSCVFALLVSCFIFKSERFTANKIIASILCFAGVIVSGVGTSFAGVSFSVGDLLIMLSALSYSFSSAFLKRYSTDYSPYMLSGYQFVLGGLVMSAVGLAMHGTLDASNTKGMLVMIYLAFVSAIAYSLWGMLLKYNPVSRIAVCGAMTPIFGYLLSVLIFGDNASSMLPNLLALALVVIGIIIMNAKLKERV